MHLTSERDVMPIAGTAVFVTFLLVIFFSYVLKGFSGLSLLSPWLLPAAVFYWGLFRPKLVGYFIIFVLGLFEDGLAGVPFGLHAFGLLLLLHMASYQRHYLEHNPFPVIWTAFIVNMLMVFAAMALLMWLASVEVTMWVAGSWLVSVALFPVVYMVMGRLHEALMED